MGFFDWLKKPKILNKTSTWRELGTYNAFFLAFGTDIYKSGVVRSCIRPLAEHSSKANAVCKDKSIEFALNYKPNLYMTGKDMLSKVRTWLELKNTAFILIMRDDNGKANGFYPVPYTSFEALDYNGNLYLQFSFANAGRSLIASWEDLVVLRKDYNKSDISGDDNSPIVSTLENLNTADQGVANAIKATANLRGILKSTKAMLKPEDIKQQKDDFVRDYLSLENGSGIASLDSTQEFTPISMNPTMTSWETRKEFREDVQRYYGVSEAIITSNYSESQMNAFYEARIEPFLVALSLEMTRKVFSKREIAFENIITYESGRIQYASTKTKLDMVAMVDRGAMTPNEWRALLNMAPIEGGDKPIRRLDTEVVNTNNEESEENEDGSEG